MRKRNYAALFFLSLLMLGVAAWFQSSPGYMDADYYLVGGRQLARGEGFQEWVLWNYLDDPQGLPHPSHGYWMPLASILAAGGIRLAGAFLDEFSAARLGFILVAAFIAPTTAWLGWKLTANRRQALLAGVLALFPGFYWPYLATTDTFGIVMVLGTLFLLEVLDESKAWHRKGWFLVGLLAGGMHLARADGWIWLGVAGMGVILAFFPVRKIVPGISAGTKQKGRNWGKFLYACISLAAGYVVVIGPWLFRNYQVFGSMLAPGGLRGAWILEYDELFAFPASILTFDRWWEAGLGEILRSRLWALGQNMQTLVAVQGMILLLPLAILGGWQFRKKQVLQLAALGWGIVLGVMTVIFPYQGARGGFFHSGAAFQGVIWVLAAVGLDQFLEWGRKKRGWRLRQARRIFTFALVGYSLLLTVGINASRLLPGEQGTGWNTAAEKYAILEAHLAALGANPGERVMVNNPPGYFYVANRPAVVVPVTDLDGLQEAMRKYEVKYLLLDENYPAGLAELYREPGAFPGFEFLETIDDTHIFRYLP